MKIKEGFLLKKIAGDHIVVPVGENLVDFGSVVVLNETGVLLWQCLQEDKDEQQLTAAILAEYEVAPEIAAADVKEFVGNLKEKDLVV